jgi:signal transduction histidine kinase
MMNKLIEKEEARRPFFGIFPKLLLSFLTLSMIPLIVLGYLADRNLAETGTESIAIAKGIGEKSLRSAREIGEVAIEDSVRALDEKSTEAIELRTMELAGRIADFLYERDKDILLLASIEPDPQKYLAACLSCNRDVIEPGPWPREAKIGDSIELLWSNPENRVSWRHRPPDDYKRITKPLYREITFIDLSGRERIKIRDGRISDDLKDVSQKENTFCRAEDYFSHLHSLKQGELYVSRMIGEHKRGWLYKTDKGIQVKPESAYAGKENPYGEKFEGLIRWATPVYEGGKKTGYLTLALDHTHIMEFTDHVVPTEERFSDLSDGGSGNYAFLWDDQDQCISHARDFFICGYDPRTGKEVPGWLSQMTYDEYKNSGLTLEAFAAALPSFRDHTQKKAGSKEQLASGCIPLDCRILDTAPQCEGWHRGTEDGGSGSFLISWSGLWKLTTYATVPYYTGRYGSSKRGFGYVTIGANVDDFHKAASITSENIEKSIVTQGNDIQIATDKARELIEHSTAATRRLIVIITIIAALAVIAASIMLGLAITRPLKRLNEGARAITLGDFRQHIVVKSGDEIGELARSFNKMARAVAEVDRMKSEFVTVASHELRTPIHAMLLAVSGVLEGYSGKISDEIREDLQIANEGISRLMHLVENLLDLSRIEARKFELNITTISVDHIIGRAIREVSRLIEAHDHAIIKNISADIPYIHADGEKIAQLLINLLSNSIKYTPEGGKILIGVEKEGEEVVLSIADNGYGIPPEAQDRVFEKFFQADSIMSQRVGGSGLGLAITKGIVEEHGGNIHFESPIPEGRFSDLPLGGERKGTVFVVRLPIKRDTKQ